MRVATVLRQEGITLRRQGLNDEQVNEAAAPRVALDPVAPWHLPHDCLQSAETPWRDDPAASGAAVS